MKSSNDDNIQRSDAVTRAAGSDADWIQRALVAILGMTDGEWAGTEILDCVKRFVGNPSDKSVWGKLIHEAERADIIEHTGRFKSINGVKGKYKAPVYYVHSVHVE